MDVSQLVLVQFVGLDLQAELLEDLGQVLRGTLVPAGRQVRGLRPRDGRLEVVGDDNGNPVSLVVMDMVVGHREPWLGENLGVEHGTRCYKCVHYQPIEWISSGSQ